MNTEHDMPDDCARSDDYARIEQAITFLEDHYREQPNLETIAASVHLSKYHFDRLFKRWAGVSPKQFLQFLTLTHCQQQLSQAQSLQETAYEAGLSGTGRLHDLFVTFEAMTPGEYKKMGAGLEIAFGIAPSPFGDCLIGTTSRGVCHLAFIENAHLSDALRELQDFWPASRFVERQHHAETLINRIFQPDTADKPVHLHVRGTNFQVQVWKALLRVPEGQVVSYEKVAQLIDRPRSVRAVASAVAKNNIGYLIPCHRVINKSGRINQYRWGSARKKALVGWEAAQIQQRRI